MGKDPCLSLSTGEGAWDDKTGKGHLRQNGRFVQRLREHGGGQQEISYQGPVPLVSLRLISDLEPSAHFP